MYNLELAKSVPRNGAISLLTSNTVDEDKKKVLSEDDFDTDKEFSMTWHKGTKCILQDNKIFDFVTKELIEKIKYKEPA